MYCTKIFQLKGLKPKTKGRTNFYECCDLTKKVYLMYSRLVFVCFFFVMQPKPWYNMEYPFNYTWRFAVFLICCWQTAKIIDLLSANRQQTAKNIPYEKVNILKKILSILWGSSLYILMTVFNKFKGRFETIFLYFCRNLIEMKGLY